MSARRSYGTGSIIERNGVYYGKWRDDDRQVKRKIGPVRTPHRPDGLTKTQAEARLRDLIQRSRPLHPSRTPAPSTPPPTRGSRTSRPPARRRPAVRAYRAALDRWFLPTLKTRSLDRITTADVEHAMARMRKAQLSDKTIRNYVGTLRALFNFAADKRRRWTTRNPVDDVELPRAPTYAEIRYLTTDEVWTLVEAVRPVPITGTEARPTRRSTRR